ncbi:MAG: hypothetical protein EBV68_12395 [Betaproteobacteria bacterium]|nr:hypothetical protein [Betaproteobacteria bacterium]
METASASIIFLLLVAVIAVVLGLLARQWRRPVSLGALQVLSTTPLGQRERLVEVLHGEEVLVLGVTSQSISVIDRRQATEAERTQHAAQGRFQRSAFSQRFLGSTLVLFCTLLMFGPNDLWAQSIPLFEAVPSKGGGTSYSVPVQTVLLLTALSFLPSMLMLMTSFTRILIVLSLLRQAMGLVTTPPNAVLIGFVIYLPFLAIDFAVASILTALGMVMVSPITFSLPLKLIVFVLADGWAMLIGGLVDSFKMSG